MVAGQVIIGIILHLIHLIVGIIILTIQGAVRQTIIILLMKTLIEVLIALRAEAGRSIVVVAILAEDHAVDSVVEEIAAAEAVADVNRIKSKRLFRL